MELARRLGILKPKETPRRVTIAEILGPEVKGWEEAFLGKSFLQQDAYAAVLTRRDDPSKKVYTTVVAGPFRRTSIDIPLVEHTPRELLAREAYETTFFSEIDPERYRAFATGEFNYDKLMAFLNRNAAAVSSSETPEWFYRTFGVNHLESFGSVFVGSHGVQGAHGYNFNASIENRAPRVVTGEATVDSAISFAREAQRAIRHIAVNPLPVETYLDDLQSALKFLPEDWE